MRFPLRVRFLPRGLTGRRVGSPRRGVVPSGTESEPEAAHFETFALRGPSSGPQANCVTATPNDSEQLTDKGQAAQRFPRSFPFQRFSSAFTLVELMVVIAIMLIMAALIAPAFTSLKSAGDVTGAAYTIKGVLEQARTYAMANNTYTWVGFYEEDTSKPSASPTATPGTGRLVMAIVASKDGTNIYGSNTGTIDPTKLSSITKLVKIDNVHLPLFAICTANCTGNTFDTRPAIQYDPAPAGYNYSRFGELNGATPNTAPYTTPYNFQYPVGNPAPTAQYTFNKLLQFNPRGETRVNGDSYDVRRVVEIGLIQTHGKTVPNPISGGGISTATYSGNVAALQISGFGGNTKIYRR